MKTAPAIGFRYHGSPLLAGVTVVVAALAIASLHFVRGPAWLHEMLAVLVGGYALLAVYGLLRPRILAIAWHADGATELTLRHGAGHDTAQGAVAEARVLGPLIALTLRWPPRERMTLWLLPDNLDADTRRRLRMRLGAEGAGTLSSGNADGH